MTLLVAIIPLHTPQSRHVRQTYRLQPDLTLSFNGLRLASESEVGADTYLSIQPGEQEWQFTNTPKIMTMAPIAT